MAIMVLRLTKKNEGEIGPVGCDDVDEPDW